MRQQRPRASSTTQCWKSIPIASTPARSGAPQTPPRSRHRRPQFPGENLANVPRAERRKWRSQMNNVSFENEDRVAVDASAGVEPLNGNGFYRFKIGDFQATVISDGQGPIPVSPILVMNASEAELAPVLRANFMQPAIQATNNPLVVDTGR